MIWAVDLDAFDHRSLWGAGGSFVGYGAAYKGVAGWPPISKSLIQGENLAKKADNQQSIIGLVCRSALVCRLRESANKGHQLLFWTECGKDPKCPVGFKELTRSANMVRISSPAN
jgi:hypothetical protein